MDKLELFVFGPLVIAATLLVIVKLIRPAIARFRSRPLSTIADTLAAPPKNS